MTSTIARCLLSVVIALLVSSCAQTTTVPDQTFYRLPEPKALPKSTHEVFPLTIVVGTFAADGLYADRALIYALEPEARELRQYHYQLWTDPPTRLLQRRLVGLLRDAEIAPVVIDLLPASEPAVRISGAILRFERVPTADGGQLASVALKLRVDQADGTPMIDDIYRADALAPGKSLGASTDAIGAAIDQVFAEFHADLIKQREPVDAR